MILHAVGSGGVVSELEDGVEVKVAMVVVVEEEEEGGHVSWT